MPTSRSAVRDYYEQNTRLFLAVHRSQKAENIHRSLWTDGAKTLEQALHVTNERICEEIAAVAPQHARIADLGCGVGAGLLYIVPRLHDPAPAIGLTLSPTQARLAGEFSKRAGCEDGILFAEGDFTCVPLAERSLDVIFSVEAVVHAEEPERYFQEASRVLRPGGRLIVVDDFRSERQLSKAESDWLHAFMTGWHVPGVSTVEQMCAWGELNQLRLWRDDDLTPFLRLHNLPEALARGLRFLGNQLPFRHAILPSMLGSMALQQCLHQGVVEYRFLVFERM